MRIMVVGGAGFGNYGDEALLRATVQACHRSVPNAKIVVASNNPLLLADTLCGCEYEVVPSPRYFFFGAGHDYGSASETFRRQWYAIRKGLVGRSLLKSLWKITFKPALRFIDRRDAVRFLFTLYSCDALVIHGGGILTSATRSRLWEHSLTAQIAAGAGLRVLLRSHQFGPYSEAEDEARLREIVEVSNFMSCRDRGASAQAVRAIEPEATVYEQVDDALYVSYPSGDAEKTLERFGLIQGRYICVGFRNNPSVDFDGRHAGSMASIIRIAHERTGLPIVLLPQGTFDIPALDDLTGC